MMTDDPLYLYAVPLFYSVASPPARAEGRGRSDLYSWSITSIPDYTLGEIPVPGVGGGGTDNTYSATPFCLFNHDG